MTFNVMPSGWRKAVTKEGRTFFFDPMQSQTLWEMPLVQPLSFSIDAIFFFF